MFDSIISKRALEKVASDLWLDGGFASGTPWVSSTIYNWLVLMMWQKMVTIIEIPNSNYFQVQQSHKSRCHWVGRPPGVSWVKCYENKSRILFVLQPWPRLTYVLPSFLGLFSWGCQTDRLSIARYMIDWSIMPWVVSTCHPMSCLWVL